jgi:hypothetical protein
VNGAADSVEEFVHAVDIRLPGPPRLREDILAELSDGLLEAAEANERAGLERGHAIQVAVREFGRPEALATSFREELMVARGRRTALVLLAMTPIVVALWIAAARSRHATGASRLFDSPLDHLAAGLLLAALALCGAWTIVTSGRASRWLDTPPVASLFGAVAIGALTLAGDMLALAVLSARLADFSGPFHKLALAAAIAASCLSALLAGRACCSCLAMARTGPASALGD